MKLSGKKTYSVGAGMILAAITPIFTEDGIDLSKLNLPMLLNGIGIITLRQGIAKGAKTKTDFPDNA